MLTGELRTPLEIITRLDEVIYEAKKSTHIVHEARMAHLKAKHAYLLAFKKSKLGGAGSISDREDQAQLENWQLFEQMEIAEAALLHARELRRDLEDELSKLQTEGGLVKKEMDLSR